MLVSDHVVKLNCFTVRDDFFAFPIDFFWGLPPSLYADEVLCAASRAALPPHILFGWRKNRKWRNSMQVGENAFSCNKYALPPHILFVWRKILDISLKKKWKKHVNDKCENWALVRTRAQLLQFLGAPKWASKSSLNANMTSTFFLRRDKISQKNPKSSKLQNFRLHCHWHSHKITLNANMTPTLFLRRDKISQKITKVQSFKIFARTGTEMHRKKHAKRFYH